MRELEKKQKIKRRIYSWPVLICLLFGVLGLMRGAVAVLEKRALSERELENLQAKVIELKDREDKLQSDIKRLKTPEGIDEEIKEKFSVAEEGEKVVIIVDDKPEEATTTVEIVPWYRRFWNAVRNL